MKSKRKSVRYQEGDWFAVPLKPAGYALGRIARVAKQGFLLGYFFGTRYKALPTEEDTQGLSHSDAILVARFSDLGLLKRSWPIVSTPLEWNPKEWPLPAFSRIIEFEDQELAWRVEYSGSDLVNPIRESRIAPEEAHRLPNESAWGDIALATYLSDTLPK